MSLSRNAPCPCGARKPTGEPVKYKLCCLAKDEAQRKPQTGQDAVVICMPTRGTVSHETLQSIEHNMDGVKYAVIRVARKPVAEARNLLAKTALEQIPKNPFPFTPRETLLLWLDDDCWLPPGLVKNMINCMRDCPKLDALFAWFCARMPMGPPVAYRNIDDREASRRLG